MGLGLTLELLRMINDLLNDGASVLAEVGYDILPDDGKMGECGYEPIELEINVITQGVFDLYTIIFEFKKLKSGKTAKYVKPNINKTVVTDNLEGLFKLAIKEHYGKILHSEETISRVVESHMKILEQ